MYYLILNFKRAIFPFSARFGGIGKKGQPGGCEKSLLCFSKKVRK